MKIIERLWVAVFILLPPKSGSNTYLTGFLWGYERVYYLYIAYNPQKLLQWFIRIPKIQKDKLEIGEKDNMKIEIGNWVLRDVSSMQ